MNLNISQLLESNIEAAELCLAVRSISDTLQSLAEKLADIQIQDLPTIIERVKAQFGIQYGEQMQGELSGIIQGCLTQLQSAKNTMDNSALKLSGDNSGENIPTPVESTPVETPVEGEEPIENAEPEQSGPASEPLGRAVKESVKLFLEMNNGQKGFKTFANQTLAESWIVKFENDIKTLRVVV